MPAGEPLTKPEHLRPVEKPSASAWLAKRPFALAAGILGIIAFTVVWISQGEVWTTPDWRISVPGFAVTAIASIVSLARREKHGYWIWGIGLALAAASIVLGWFLMIAIIIGAVAVLMAILQAIL